MLRSPAAEAAVAAETEAAALRLGIIPQMINGRRITDSKTLDIAIMTYAGLVNKKIVSKLQKLNCNSIGLSGADGNLIKSKIISEFIENDK